MLQPSVVLVVVHPEQSLLPAPHRPHGKNGHQSVSWEEIGWLGSGDLMRGSCFNVFSCFFSTNVDPETSQQS